MKKLLVRIVAIVLIPCLIAESSFTATWPYIGNHLALNNVSQLALSRFNTIALSNPGLSQSPDTRGIGHTVPSLSGLIQRGTVLKNSTRPIVWTTFAAGVVSVVPVFLVRKYQLSWLGAILIWGIIATFTWLHIDFIRSRNKPEAQVRRAFGYKDEYHPYPETPDHIKSLLKKPAIGAESLVAFALSVSDKTVLKLLFERGLGIVEDKIQMPDDLQKLTTELLAIRQKGGDSVWAVLKYFNDRPTNDFIDFGHAIAEFSTKHTEKATQSLGYLANQFKTPEDINDGDIGTTLDKLGGLPYLSGKAHQYDYLSAKQTLKEGLQDLITIKAQTNGLGTWTFPPALAEKFGTHALIPVAHVMGQQLKHYQEFKDLYESLWLFTEKGIIKTTDDMETAASLTLVFKKDGEKTGLLDDPGKDRPNERIDVKTAIAPGIGYVKDIKALSSYYEVVLQSAEMSGGYKKGVAHLLVFTKGRIQSPEEYKREAASVLKLVQANKIWRKAIISKGGWRLGEVALSLKKVLPLVTKYGFSPLAELASSYGELSWVVLPYGIDPARIDSVESFFDKEMIHDRLTAKRNTLQKGYQTSSTWVMQGSGDVPYEEPGEWVDPDREIRESIDQVLGNRPETSLSRRGPIAHVDFNESDGMRHDLRRGSSFEAQYQGKLDERARFEALIGRKSAGPIAHVDRDGLQSGAASNSDHLREQWARSISEATDGQQIRIEFPESMTIDEINSKGLVNLSILANDQPTHKTFEIVRKASEANSHSVEIIVYQRIWVMDTKRDGYDQLVEFTAKQLKVQGANRDRTEVIPYFRTTEAGDTVAWYLHYPDGSEEVVYGSVPSDKQKKADMMIWAIAERAKRSGYDTASRDKKAELPLTGTVTSIDATAGTFGVQKGPQESSKLEAKKVQVIKQGQVVSLAELKVGDQVTVTIPRLKDDAPSFAFDHKSIDADPTELAMIWTASSGRKWAIMGNPFPLWPPKESLKPGEMQTLHFTVSRYAPPLTDEYQRQKNIGSEENNRDMAELADYLNRNLEGRPAIWTVANGWYPNDDPSNTLKAGVTQSVAHFQIGNQRFPIENMTRVDPIGAAGQIKVGVIAKSNGFASALVYDAPDKNFADVPRLVAAAIQQMRERGHTFNIFYSKKDSGGWRVFVYDRTVGVPELFSNEWAYAELSQAIAGDDIMRLFELTPGQLREFERKDVKETPQEKETAQKQWVKDHRKELKLRPDIWNDIQKTLQEVSAPDEEVTAIAHQIIESASRKIIITRRSLLTTLTLAGLLARLRLKAQTPPENPALLETITQGIEKANAAYRQLLRDTVRNKGSLDMDRLANEGLAKPLSALVVAYGSQIPELSRVMEAFKNKQSVGILDVMDAFSGYFKRHRKFFHSDLANVSIDGVYLEGAVDIILAEEASFPKSSIPSQPLLKSKTSYTAIQSVRIPSLIAAAEEGGDAGGWTNRASDEARIVGNLDVGRTHAGKLWDRLHPYASFSDDQLLAKQIADLKAKRFDDFLEVVAVRLMRRSFGEIVRLPRDRFVTAALPIVMNSILAHERSHVAVEEGAVIPKNAPAVARGILDETEAQFGSIQYGTAPHLALMDVLNWTFQSPPTEYTSAGQNILKNLLSELAVNKKDYSSMNLEAPPGLTPAEGTFFNLMQLPSLTPQELVRAATRVREQFTEQIQKMKFGSVAPIAVPVFARRFLFQLLKRGLNSYDIPRVSGASHTGSWWDVVTEQGLLILSGVTTLVGMVLAGSAGLHGLPQYGLALAAGLLPLALFVEPFVNWHKSRFLEIAASRGITVDQYKNYLRGRFILFGLATIMATLSVPHLSFIAGQGAGMAVHALNNLFFLPASHSDQNNDEEASSGGSEDRSRLEPHRVKYIADQLQRRNQLRKQASNREFYVQVDGYPVSLPSAIPERRFTVPEDATVVQIYTQYRGREVLLASHILGHNRDGEISKSSGRRSVGFLTWFSFRIQSTADGSGICTVTRITPLSWLLMVLPIPRSWKDRIAFRQVPSIRTEAAPEGNAWDSLQGHHWTRAAQSAAEGIFTNWVRELVSEKYPTLFRSMDSEEAVGILSDIVKYDIGVLRPYTSPSERALKKLTSVMPSSINVPELEADLRNIAARYGSLLDKLIGASEIITATQRSKLRSIGLRIANDLSEQYRLPVAEARVVFENLITDVTGEPQSLSNDESGPGLGRRGFLGALVGGLAVGVTKLNAQDSNAKAIAQARSALGQIKTRLNALGFAAAERAELSANIDHLLNSTDGYTIVTKEDPELYAEMNNLTKTLILFSGFAKLSPAGQQSVLVHEITHSRRVQAQRDLRQAALKQEINAELKKFPLTANTHSLPAPLVAKLKELLALHVFNEVEANEAELRDRKWYAKSQGFATYQAFIQRYTDYAPWGDARLRRNFTKTASRAEIVDLPKLQPELIGIVLKSQSAFALLLGFMARTEGIDLSSKTAMNAWVNQWIAAMADRLSISGMGPAKRPQLMMLDTETHGFAQYAKNPQGREFDKARYIRLINKRAAEGLVRQRDRDWIFVQKAVAEKPGAPDRDVTRRLIELYVAPGREAARFIHRSVERLRADHGYAPNEASPIDEGIIRVKAIAQRGFFVSALLMLGSALMLVLFVPLPGFHTWMSDHCWSYVAAVTTIAIYAGHYFANLHVHFKWNLENPGKVMTESDRLTLAAA